MTGGVINEDLLGALRTRARLTPAIPALVGSRVLGFGADVPPTTVSAEALGLPFAKSADWVEARTGIRRLHRVDSAEQLSDLVGAASADALSAAQTDRGAVDLVITTSCSVTDVGPVNVLAGRAAPRAAHMHINAACSGFCYALSTADSLIRAGSASTVLIVAVEQMSSLLDPTDLGTSIIFGDGAGAAVVGAAGRDEVGIGPVVWGSDGGQRGLITCETTPGGRLAMAGSSVFRWAIQTVPDLARTACARAGVTLDQIEVFVPHQANKRIVDAVARDLGLTDTVVADSVVTTGNTSAASIPIAVAELAARGDTRPGQLALLVGFGAGLTYAAQVIRLP